MESYELVISKVTQGDTSTPSVYSIKPYTVNSLNQRSQCIREFAARFKIAKPNTLFDAAGAGAGAALAPVSGYGETTKTHAAARDLEIRSFPGSKATGTLTLTGVVLDGQYVRIGSRYYEIDTDGIVTTGRRKVDCASYATAATSELTLDTQPTAGKLLVIGTRTYVFVPNGAANYPGEISVETDLATAKAAIIAAINGTDNVNPANDFASAASGTGKIVFSDRIPGSGRTIATTTTEVGGNNAFSGVSLSGGVSCTAANAVTAIVAALTADAACEVDASDGAGDTVAVSYKTYSATGNSVVTTESMANASWGHDHLQGGATAVPGEIRVSVANDNAVDAALRLLVGAPEFKGLPVDYSLLFADVVHVAP